MKFLSAKFFQVRGSLFFRFFQDSADRVCPEFAIKRRALGYIRLIGLVWSFVS